MTLMTVLAVAVQLNVTVEKSFPDAVNTLVDVAQEGPAGAAGPGGPILTFKM